MTARTMVKTAILGAVISAAGVVMKRFFQQKPRELRAAGDAVGVREGEGLIRNAGPAATRTAPGRKWKPEDEASDQSFPASDPPGQGVG